MDNLKTNHRGTFVLLDASHRPLRALSGDAPLEEAAGGQEVGGAPVLVATPASVGSEGAARATAAGARAHLAFGRGFARGAMQALGLGCTGVTLDKAGRVRVDDFQWTGVEGCVATLHLLLTDRSADRL